MNLAGWIAGVLALTGCAQIDEQLNGLRSAPAVAQAAPSAGSTEARRVLVVVNSRSRESQELGAYYARRRGIPSHLVFSISCPDQEQIPSTEYKDTIESPIRERLKALPTVDFILLTRGIPIRVDSGGGDSVDSLLAAMDLPKEPSGSQGGPTCIKNPYGAASEPFSSQKFRMRLVTRLDGYTLADARRLVDSSLAAKPEKGLFFMDEADNMRKPAYSVYQENYKKAKTALDARGLESRIETTSVFADPGAPLMGYVSWGSNDAGFRPEIYKKLTFKPGAIAETFVSTSGRTFRPTQGGQSLIADLIAQGVTGVKGYVSEPFAFALAQPQVLFDRYSRGFCLAEAFYAASPVVRWKDVVIGDPLCRPYRLR